MRIAAAAVRVGDKIYIGSTHFEASLKFINLPGMSEAKTDDGYVTDTGRFLNREEAFWLALTSGQANGELADPKRNINFYGTTRPRLESGIVENFAMLRADFGFI